ncbi:MAG: hypothetical protein IPK88_18200 [Saprospiraceae bacterium]|nr:hypothetical protein [Candidatus Defluviibacterium haderslevense]
MISIKLFDPIKVGLLETKIWQAYYRHEYINLIRYLFLLLKILFKSDYYSLLRATFYAAKTTIHFSISKGNEKKDMIVCNLSKFFEIINSKCEERINYKLCAEMEYNWWMVDRYPQRYKTSRIDAIAQAMATFYNIEKEDLYEFARLRTEAMLLQDNAELENKNPDWEIIEKKLTQSYINLKKCIQ